MAAHSLSLMLDIHNKRAFTLVVWNITVDFDF